MRGGGGERFELLERVAQGGMGTVYRARDRETGRIAALKRIDGPTPDAESLRRFAREASVLETVSHPQVVQHLAHGTTTEGTPFLAMEWLEGEDLAHRLERERLTFRESLSVVRCVASALGAAHARGVVHRDVKPSNIFLRGGRLDDAVLVDFGLARPTFEPTAAQPTRTGIIVGTPTYMAPEQARGLRQLSPAVDIYALGCVLFRCLTGLPPFQASELLALLALILFGDTPDIRRYRPALPAPASDLVRCMLAKEPADRPRDAATLLSLLEPLLELPDLPPPAEDETSRAPTFGEREKQLVAVLVARTPSLVVEADALATFRAALAIFGARGERLEDGTLLAAAHVDGRRAANDQAVQAVRGALTLQAAWPSAKIALAMGRSADGDQGPLGDAVDRAVALLDDAADQDDSLIVVDDVTAGLLGGRFALAPRAGTRGGHDVLDGQERADELRVLLGKPTPCVGREQELAMLEGLVARAAEDAAAAAMVLLGVPGAGKSRIRHELIRRLGSSVDGVEVLVGRADVDAQAVSYALLRDLLFRTPPGLPAPSPATQWDTLRERCARTSEPSRVAAFVGELGGLRDDADRSERVLLARQDARRMAEEIAQAVIELLRSECARRPLVLLLEDLHWADAPSVRLVGRALRELADRPFVVLAFARPDLDPTVLDAWPECARVPLRPLGKRAATTLARAVLGPDAAAPVVDRIVAQAAGNALYLEELIRFAAEGRSEELPESVLAMLQSRIARLPADVRRILRASSVFGETVPHAGVAAVLGTEANGATLSAGLQRLVEAEILEARGADGEARARSYVFRHALMRDAAYALLTDVDCREAHRSAAQYFEELGDCEPVVLAEHFKRAGDYRQTALAYVRAGEREGRVGALAEARRMLSAAHELFTEMAEDGESTRARVDVLVKQAEIGLTADPPLRNLERLGEARALLDSIQRERGEAPEADLRRRGRIELLSARVAVFLFDRRAVLGYAERATAIATELDDERLAIMAGQAAADIHYACGHVNLARPLLARGFANVELFDTEVDRLRVAGYYAMVLVSTGEVAAGFALHEEGIAQATAANSGSGLAVALTLRAFSEFLLRDTRRALATGETLLAIAKASGEHVLLYFGSGIVGVCKGLAGDASEGYALLRASAEISAQLGGALPYADGFAAGEAHIALYAGDYDRAIRVASALAPRLLAEGRLTGAALATGVWGLAIAYASAARFEEAAAHVREALAIMDGVDGRNMASALRLEWAHVCRARGRTEEANAARSSAVAYYEAGGRPELPLSLEAELPAVPL